MTIRVYAGPNLTRKVGQSLSIKGIIRENSDNDKLKYYWKQTYGPKQRLYNRRSQKCTITCKKKGWCIFRFVAKAKGSKGFSNAGWDYMFLTVK